MKDPVREVARHLERVDPRLSSILREVGPTAPPRRPGGFPALVRAIIYQQVSGAAGDAILRKVRATASGSGGPTPEWFRDSPIETLRGAGLSSQKSAYLRDLAARVLDGRLSFADLRRASDEEVVETLSEVHGIGRWTAQMYLLFNLGRPDVLPTGDLGLRKAVQRWYGFSRLPAERTVERVGRVWAPYRSHATYYLWRSLALPAPAGEAPRSRKGPKLNGASRRTSNLPKRRRRPR
jgi:DNA-3-methyladenine glycosylase II